MVYYIDLDVYFCLNFLMDFIVILAVHRWNHCIRKIRYCILAALIGAIYSVTVFLFLNNKIITWICTYLIVGQVLVLISMGYRGLKKHLAYLGELYLGMLFSIGIIEIAAGIFAKNTMYDRQGSLWGKINVRFCVLIAAVSYMIFRIILNRLKIRLKVHSNITEVKISVGEQNICLHGLCDSGNMLVEPVTGKAVCVMDESVLKDLKTANLMPVFIPYNTIDKKHGIMKGFWIDRIEVNHHTFDKVPFAVHQGKLSTNSTYEIILPPEIFNQRGKSDVCRRIGRTKITKEDSVTCRNHSADGRRTPLHWWK